MSLPSSIPVEVLPQHFDIDRSVINLENGYWGVMPRSTAALYAEKIAFLNRFRSLYADDGMPGQLLSADLHQARESVAQLLAVSAEEIAFTRSGSEGLQSLITNYNGLKPGDAVLHCDLDYGNTIAALRTLANTRGSQVVGFNMPEPATTANILQAYEDVLRQTPNAKLLLLTHVSHRTGLVLPVAEIIAMARARGVDTVLDSAHGVGCLNFTLPETGADFIGWSMHKWLAAPLSLGAIYIRQSRLGSIDLSPYGSFANPEYPSDDIRSRVPPGAVNFAAQLTVPVAIAFHRAVGPATKEQHLRSLRNHWVDRARAIPGLQITVPDDPARSCAITSFRLRGMHTPADAARVHQRLLYQHNIFTAVRTGIAAGPALRVTPGLSNTYADLDALVTALEAEHAMLL